MSQIHIAVKRKEVSRERAICKDCGDIFLRRRKDSSSKSQLPKGVRGKNCTVCLKCANKRKFCVKENNKNYDDCICGKRKLKTSEKCIDCHFHNYN